MRPTLPSGKERRGPSLGIQLDLSSPSQPREEEGDPLLWLLSALPRGTCFLLPAPTSAHERLPGQQLRLPDQALPVSGLRPLPWPRPLHQPHTHCLCGQDRMTVSKAARTKADFFSFEVPHGHSSALCIPERPLCSPVPACRVWTPGPPCLRVLRPRLAVGASAQDPDRQHPASAALWALALWV